MCEPAFTPLARAYHLVCKRPTAHEEDSEAQEEYKAAQEDATDPVQENLLQEGTTAAAAAAGADASAMEEAEAHQIKDHPKLTCLEELLTDTDAKQAVGSCVAFAQCLVCSCVQ
jgi:hypothetical protein